MKDTPHLISMLRDNNPDTRYEACEYLRVSREHLPQDALDALILATNDLNRDVADAARRALAIHAPNPSTKTNAISDSENSTNLQGLGKQSAFITCSEIVLSVVIGCILGGVFGFTYGSMYEKGLTIPWYSLGTPPEPAQKIIVSTLFSLTVQSPNGQNYTFQEENILYGSPSGQWVKSDEPLEQWEINPRCKIDATYASPPPSPAIDISSGDYCGEVGFHVEYAILEDGSVWRWSTPGGFHSFIYGFNGLIVGVFVSLIALVVIKSVSLSIKSNVKEPNNFSFAKSGD